MADEEVLQILREIRDLQKAHLSNQQLAIEMQKRGVRRQKVSLLVALAIVFLGLAIIAEPLFRR
ncbi:MAG: hypothetical protein ABSD63_03755 [Candidatus Korobacteraceae bacterium]|jgi:uncharacterized membrane protein YdbT with pleckstrin-like domain